MNIEDARILVVEDDAVMRQFVLGLLRRLGVHQVQEAVDGQSGLAAAKSFWPDVVLTDIHMRPVGGLEFVKLLRAHASQELRKIPVLLMTADNRPDTLKESVTLGIAGYIIKPPVLASLKLKLQHALKDQS